MAMHELRVTKENQQVISFYLPGNINSLAASFQESVEEVIEEFSLPKEQAEALARHIREAFCKFLLDNHEEPDPIEEDY